jgi:hypothetical protein
MNADNKKIKKIEKIELKKKRTDIIWINRMGYSQRTENKKLTERNINRD